MSRPTPEQVQAALHGALDNVTAQILAMPVPELLGAEDLEWSFDGPHAWWVHVEVEHQESTDHGLTVNLTAAARSRFSPRRRAVETRQVTVPST
jgi:hypothetical protein